MFVVKFFEYFLYFQRYRRLNTVHSCPEKMKKWRIWTLEPFNFDYKLIRTSVLRVIAKHRIKIAQFLKKSKRAASERLHEFLTSLKYSFFKIQSRRADPHNKEMRGLRMKHVFLNTIFNFKCLYLYNYSRYSSKT